MGRHPARFSFLLVNDSVRWHFGICQMSLCGKFITYVHSGGVCISSAPYIFVFTAHSPNPTICRAHTANEHLISRHTTASLHTNSLEIFHIRCEWSEVLRHILLACFESTVSASALLFIGFGFSVALLFIHDCVSIFSRTELRHRHRSHFKNEQHS